MDSTKKKELSSFAQCALDFDTNVQELERLSRQIEAANLDKDNGRERAKKLMGYFSECGMRVAEGVNVLAKELAATRERAEKATQLVTAHAASFQVYQEDTTRILERFKAVGTKAHNLTLSIGDMKTPNAAQISDLEMNLTELIDETRSVRDEARDAGLQQLERNAENLSQSLISARAQLKTVKVG